MFRARRVAAGFALAALIAPALLVAGSPAGAIPPNTVVADWQFETTDDSFVSTCVDFCEFPLNIFLEEDQDFWIVNDNSAFNNDAVSNCPTGDERDFGTPPCGNEENGTPAHSGIRAGLFDALHAPAGTQAGLPPEAKARPAFPAWLDAEDPPKLHNISNTITVRSFARPTDVSLRNANEHDTNFVLVSKSAADVNQSWVLGITNEPFGSPNSICPASVTRPAAYFYVETVSGSTSPADTALSCSAVSIPLNVYSEITGSYDSTSGIAKVFVGAMNVTVPVRTLPGRTIALSSAPVWIGARAINGFHGWFTGQIDDVRITTSG